MSKSHPTGLEALATWLALPVYAWQGLGVRRRTSRMPPPESSSELAFPGRGEPLRILVIGDSSAAGVGVERIEQSFAGILPHELARRSGRPVTARIAGMNSATAAHIRDYSVPHIEPRDFHYITLNIGANDAKNFHSGHRFRKDFGTLLYALRARFPHAAIIWSGVIDMEDCPALPQPLARILGIRSRIIDNQGRVLCRERGALAPQSEWRAVAENFSEDGFHASQQGYREWAEAMAGYILALEMKGAHLATDDAGQRPNAGSSFVG